YEPIADILASRAVKERGIYNVQNVTRDLDRHRRGEIDVHHDLFHLAEFEDIAEFISSDAVTTGKTVRAMPSRQVLNRSTPSPLPACSRDRAVGLRPGPRLAPTSRFGESISHEDVSLLRNAMLPEVHRRPLAHQR